MPRLTNTSYLLARAVLREDWLERGGFALSHLPYMDQRNLHDYFVPDSGLDEERILPHRQDTTKQRSSLPQKAGKSYALFSAAAARPRPVLAKTVTTSTEKRRRGQQRGRVVNVHGLARAEVDMKRLARALSVLAQGSN